VQSNSVSDNETVEMEYGNVVVSGAGSDSLSLGRTDRAEEQ
jgi:hypothetical protein